MLDSLTEGILDQWKWSEFVGENGGMEALHFESENCAGKRSMGKVVKQLQKMLESSAKVKKLALCSEYTFPEAASASF